MDQQAPNSTSNGQSDIPSIPNTNTVSAVALVVYTRFDRIILETSEGRFINPMKTKLKRHKTVYVPPDHWCSVQALSAQRSQPEAHV